MSILKTRLFKPPVQDGYLIRQGLLEKFINNQYKPVTLVVAPAGYGKSIAVSQWLDKTKINYSWISLSEDCNDLKEFLRLLCTAILPYLNKNEDICEILIEVPELLDFDQIAKQIVNSLADIQDEHILVLDDYHLIDNPEVHKLMQFLTKNIRPKHIITFISRFKPPLNWKKIESYDLVNEVRIDDLQFSKEEIRELSSNVFSTPLDQEISSAIYNSAEGWIVPTRLILKNLAQNKLTLKTIKDKVADKRELTFGFLEFALSESNVEVQESMMIASLFKRFSVSLLSEIFKKLYPDKKQESEHLKKQLENFISRSLFIISLDNENNWYRFHDLIGEFLNNRIYSEFSQYKINSVLLEGSKFFEDYQSFEEAIQLCVKAGNIPLAVTIIEKNRLKFLNPQRIDVLESWLNIIPAGVTENYPVLLLTRACVSEKKGLFAEMAEDLEIAKTLMPQLNEQDEHSRVQWGEYYSYQSSIDFLNGKLNIALTSSENAMQLLNHENTFLYYYTMLYRVFALNALGKSTEALDLLIQDKKIFKSIDEKTPIENHLLHTMHLMLNGHLNCYDQEAKLARDISREESHKVVFVLTSYYLALSSYMRNELEEALSYINEALDTKYLARPYWMLVCYHFKASCLIALEDLDEYKRCIVEATEFIKNFNAPYYKNLLAIMKMEFSIQTGDFNMPQKRFKSLDFRLNDLVHVYFKPFLTEVKLLIATDKKQDLEEAETLLKQYKEKARSNYNRILLLQVNCLTILLLIKQNQTKKALKQLRELLSDTKEDGLIRLYTDCGHEMKTLFNQLTADEKNDAYTNQILQSFNLDFWKERFTNDINSGKQGAMHLNTIEPYGVKITVREIKLLQLISEDLQNKEIAPLLNITTNSVKKSLYRLYKKLQVNSRSEALKKAIDLNLLQFLRKN